MCTFTKLKFNHLKSFSISSFYFFVARWLVRFFWRIPGHYCERSSGINQILVLVLLHWVRHEKFLIQMNVGLILQSCCHYLQVLCPKPTEETWSAFCECSIFKAPVHKRSLQQLWWQKKNALEKKTKMYFHIILRGRLHKDGIEKIIEIWTETSKFNTSQRHAEQARIISKNCALLTLKYKKYMDM